MSDKESILFANDAFYTAFASGDFAQMRDVWADDRDITCIHPGWRPLVGQSDVMDSWATILASGETTDIRCVGAQAFIAGDTAYVTGFERMPGTLLTATNVFVRNGARWRMVHHQAGPCQDRSAADNLEAGPTMQ
ncbi:MAG: nuclear transport factor 2 family protein [Rhodospirillales bacterium]